MQIYFSPELVKIDTQVLNIVNDRNEAIGYLAYIITEKKMYIYGQLQNEGVYEDFKDLVKPYLDGLMTIYQELDVLSHFSVGGKKLDLNEEKKNAF